MAGLFGIPGLGLPPLHLGGASGAGLNQNGAQFGASGAGDWNVNLAGSGNALQSASSMPWLLILGAVVVGVVLWKS